MANKRCTLPQGSERKTHKGYEEVFVPAQKVSSRSGFDKSSADVCFHMLCSMH